jgi:quercetin dioxygenase-like cupin family protein
MDVDLFRADTPPNARRYSQSLEAGNIRGNMGGLVIIKLGAGLELAEHTHEQEHVGAVPEGEFIFFAGQEEVRLRAGDLYRVPPNQPHGDRCTSQALIVQARAG